MGKVYNFSTGEFKTNRTIFGTAYVSGFVDYTSGVCTVRAKIYKTSGTPTAGGIGTIDWTSGGQVSNSTTSYVLRKTIEIGGFVNKVDAEAKVVSGTGSYKYIFHYNGENNSEVVTTTSSTTFTDITVANPTPEKRVAKIELWIKNTDPGAVTSEKLTAVYSELTPNYSETILSDEVTSEDITSDKNFMFTLTLPKNLIKRDEKLVLELWTLGVGNLVVDPKNDFATEETAKINIPFKIDL